MQYWDIVTRSFRISWDHKYLWLIALFSGEGGAGFNFSYNQRTTGTTVSPAQFQQQVTTWISDHIGLIVFLIVLWLVLVIAFFILAAVCEGATVRAAAEHDAERPFGLGWRLILPPPTAVGSVGAAARAKPDRWSDAVGNA